MISGIRRSGGQKTAHIAVWWEPAGRISAASCSSMKAGTDLNGRYVGVLAENDGRFGLMWECPDFFPLDGKQVVFVSPQDMLPEGFEYHNGNGTVCLTGQMDGDRFETVYQARIKGSGGFCSGAGKR